MKLNIVCCMLAACVMCSCGSRDSKVEALPSVKVVEARVSGEGVTQQYPEMQQESARSTA